MFFPRRWGKLKRTWFLGCVLCCVGWLFAPQAGYAQDVKRISLEAKDESLGEVLERLGEAYGKKFFYSERVVDVNERVTVNLKNATLDEALKAIFKGKEVRYEENENFVAIREVRNAVTVERILVRGVVRDENNYPLPGVTVVLKGTSIGFASDMEGNFHGELAGKLPLTLVFSFVGYETQEVTVKDTAALTVKMVPEVRQVDEVVVTGYANVKKSSFTGNAVKVDKEDLFKVSPTNVIDALQVFDPSLRIMKNNEMGSDPNTMPEFYIRGRSGIGVMELDKSSVSEAALSNNPNSPIFIMDGFEVSVQKVYDFDPNRIESITILKDAAATAIYGSRAANGVVVIETVAPQPGRLNVAYTFTGALTAPDLSDYNLMNASEKLEAERLAGFYEVDEDEKGNYSLLSEYENKLAAVKRGINTDWLAQPLQNEFNHTHSLAIQGGTDNLRFNVDLNYDKQRGVMKESFRERMGGGFYVDYRIKGLQLKNQISYEVVKSENSPYGSFSEYTKMLPYDTFKDGEGNYVESVTAWHSGMSTKNPLYEAVTLNNYDKTRIQDLTDNLSINWYLTNTLYFKGQVAVTMSEAEVKTFKDPLSQDFNGVEDSEKGSLDITNTKVVTWNTNFVLNYVQTIKKHNMNFSLGINTNTSTTTTQVANYRGFPSGEFSSPAFAEEIMDVPSYSDNKSRGRNNGRAILFRQQESIVRCVRIAELHI